MCEPCIRCDELDCGTITVKYTDHAGGMYDLAPAWRITAPDGEVIGARRTRHEAIEEARRLRAKRHPGARLEVRHRHDCH